LDRVGDLNEVLVGAVATGPGLGGLRELVDTPKLLWFSERQRESRSFPRPGDGDQMNAVLGALHTRYSGVQVGRMLKEVQVAPYLLLGVVDRAVLATGRAREVTTPWEVHV